MAGFRDLFSSNHFTRSQAEILRRLFAGSSTVAQLGSASAVGSRSFVTDATATTFASIVVGGGSNKVPVYADGTNWRIG